MAQAHAMKPELDLGLGTAQESGSGSGFVIAG
jgi:hypothetical protein